MAKMCLSFVFAVLIALHMGSNPVEASVDGEVLWNWEDELDMPESCAGQSYCFQKGKDYPEKTIEELLADIRESVEDPEPQNNRDTYEEPDCVTNSTESPIYYIIDKKTDKVRVVVQSPKKFNQIYSVKWCRDEGRITRDTPHFLNSNSTLRKFNIQCVTTKMDFDFFVLSDEVDPVSKKPKMEIATAKGGIPVCCRCRYNSDD